jgi:hypothetical protein
MSFSKIKVMAVVLTVAFAASAQFVPQFNARTAALAGAPMKDIVDVYAYPVMMTGYTGHIQATWDGPVLGIKAINDMISVGILANQGLVAPTLGAALVGAGGGLGGFAPAAPGGPAAFNTAYATPHLLLGFDLGTLRLGADIFFEYAGFRSDSDPSEGASSEWRASVVHPGLRLSGALDIGDMGLMLKFGMGFPSINTSEPGDAPKRSLATGLYMETGVEFGMPVGDADLKLGFDYTRSDHRFQLGDALAPASTCASVLNVYVGTEFNFMETSVAALQYTFRRDALTGSQPDVSGNPYSMGGTHRHIFSAGMENVWEKAWLFDSFQLRGGAFYLIELDVGKSSSAVVDTRFSQPGVHTDIRPVVGFGVSKSFFTLDLALDMGSWGGVLTGPDVAIATATIKF